ncbi:MAG: tRNA (adenosine(37)-N6)-threonylcarbamoyltransferase complex ATPase subunit type 1 TsaE [Syntrophomonadaceae bacterium]|nr:tRNA (adenosine(37)-N6)-threonylcarbamoyltransferase complex ATPase subunit type 1 TsaE [Syntrophomonadaceae bacterium]
MINIGAIMAGALRPGDRILLRGELGAGKTTLAKGIAQGLGFEGRVSSPTFTIMNVYQGQVPIYHLDFYRLEGEERLGEEWEESYYGDGITLIEWPASEDQDLAGIRVEIEIKDGDYDAPRRVKLTVPSGRQQILKEIAGHVDFEH